MMRTHRGAVPLLVLAFALLVGPVWAQAWWDINWTKRVRLTFDNTAQAEDLASFPVLVTLTSARIRYTDARPNGEDLRFVDADGTTILAHEIERWDPAGISYVWVAVPQIDRNSSNDFIFLYYGNPGAPDIQDPDNTWNPNYAGVWHLNQDPASAGANGITDSSGAGNHGTDQGTMSTAGGRVATAIDFGGTDGQIDIGDQASLDFGTGSFTYSVWVYVTSSVGAWDMPWWKGGQCSGCNGYDIELGTGNWHASISDGGATYPRLAFGPEASFLGRWVYLATVVDRGADEFRVYADGSFVTQMGIPGFGSLSNTDSATLGNRDDGTNPLNGILDEVRVMSGVRSADWIAAQDLSVRDNFITYGDPTAQSMVQTGSYLGDGLDSRIITGVGFTPDVVIIKGDQALEAVIRTSTMSGDASKPVIASLGIGPDMVQSLDTDGFTWGRTPTSIRSASSIIGPPSRPGPAR